MTRFFSFGLGQLVEKHKLGDFLTGDGYDILFSLKAEDNLVKSFISQELVANGILWLETFNLSYAHKRRHLDGVLTVFDEIFDKLKDILVLGEIDYGPILEKQIKGTSIKERMVRSWMDQ